MCSYNHINIQPSIIYLVDAASSATVNMSRGLPPELKMHEGNANLAIERTPKMEVEAIEHQQVTLWGLSNTSARTEIMNRTRRTQKVAGKEKGVGMEN